MKTYNSKQYQIIEVTKDCYRVVRILGEYSNLDDANQHLIKLLTGEINDDSLKND